MVNAFDWRFRRAQSFLTNGKGSFRVWSAKTRLQRHAGSTRSGSVHEHVIVIRAGRHLGMMKRRKGSTQLNGGARYGGAAPGRTLR